MSEGPTSLSTPMEPRAATRAFFGRRSGLRPGRRELHAFGVFLGEGTNNQAEYKAIVRGSPRRPITPAVGLKSEATVRSP